MAIDDRDALRSGSALQRNREASAMMPRSSDGGSAAATANPADAPRAQRKNAELAVAAAVTAATAYNASAPRLNAVRVVAISLSLRMPDFDAAHDRAAADDEHRSAGGSVAIRFVDHAAEDCQDAVLDAPAARHV